MGYFSILSVLFLSLTSSYGYAQACGEDSNSDDCKAALKPVKLSKKDPGLLKQAFFSGEPWLILCEGAEDEEKVFGALRTQALQFLQTSEGEKVKVGVLNCIEPLKSGKTPWQRFKLENLPALSPTDEEEEGPVSPTWFICANGDEPQQVPHVVLSSRSSLSLAWWLRQNTRLRIKGPLTTTKELKSECTSSGFCLVILSNSSAPGLPLLSRTNRAVIKEVKKTHRAVRVVLVNHTATLFALEEKLNPLPPAALKEQWTHDNKVDTAEGMPVKDQRVPRVLLLHTKKIRAQAKGTDGKNSKKAPKVQAVGAKAHRGAFTTKALVDLITPYTSGENQLTIETPVDRVFLANRPKVLSAKEKKQKDKEKKKRKTEQEKRKAERAAAKAAKEQDEDDDEDSDSNSKAKESSKRKKKKKTKKPSPKRHQKTRKMTKKEKKKAEAEARRKEDLRRQEMEEEQELLKPLHVDPDAYPTNTEDHSVDEDEVIDWDLEGDE